MTSCQVNVERLKFSYGKAGDNLKDSLRQPLLDIENFSISGNQKVFLQGASGSGKSTLLNIIAATLNYYEGSVVVNGVELKNISQSKKDALRANTMGFIFQQFNLLPYLSVYENIVLPATFRSIVIDQPKQERLDQLCRQLGIGDLLKKKSSTLSVGQAQRVAAARAFFLEPPLIIADEPTSSLDEDNKDKFMQLLLQLQEQTQCALLFVSHDRKLSRFFDKVYTIEAGRIL